MLQWITAIFLFVSAAVAGDEFYYISDRPVSFTSTLLIDIQQRFPSYSLDGMMEQKVKGEVSVVSEQPNAPLFSLPYDLVFVLKDMHVDLAFNGDKSSHDIRDPGTSLILAQMGGILDKPIKLRFGSDRNIYDQEGVLRKVLKENPALTTLSLNNFFNDLLELPLALAGEELSVGKKFRRQQNKEFGSQDLYFEIVAINAKTVSAKVRGEVPRHKVDAFGLWFRGNCEGVVTWSRVNPLICASDMRYRYEGEMQIDEGYGAMEYIMQHKVVADGMAMP